MSLLFNLKSFNFIIKRFNQVTILQAASCPLHSELLGAVTADLRQVPSSIMEVQFLLWPVEAVSKNKSILIELHVKMLPLPQSKHVNSLVEKHIWSIDNIHIHNNCTGVIFFTHHFIQTKVSQHLMGSTWRSTCLAQGLKPIS